MAAQSAFGRDLRVDLSRAEGLLVEPAARGSSIGSQILQSFGVQTVTRRDEVDDALQYLSQRRVDLIVCDGDLPDEDGLAFVRKLRRTRGSGDAKYVPTILLTGHCPERKVLAARDCGASLVLRKPYSPRAMLDRIVWLSRDTRAFLEGDDYVGPERPEDR